MSILLHHNGGDNASWKRHLLRSLPDMSICIYPDIPDPDAINYALVWNHPPGDLKKYPNLRAILSLGAGMEHLTNDPELPSVPLVSLGDPFMSQEMANYALHWIIYFHRAYATYRKQQHERVWHPIEYAATRHSRVSVLGMGRIACRLAEFIQQAGYQVTAWDFDRKPLRQTPAVFGAEALPELLQECDYVVCCLALTERSRRLINGDFLQHLSPDACLINISRGGIVDEEALIAALQDNQLRAAALDVFDKEPLPPEHAFWEMENVYITPHMAGPTHADSSAQILAKDIQRLERGDSPSRIFDPNRSHK